MSKKHRVVQHSMQGVFVFVLLGLFAVMSTLMVLLGAQMYRNTVDKTTENNEGRVLTAYVRSMVRAEDAYEALSVEDHDGVTALAMRESIDGEGYVTWIYQYDGQLYEQFTSGDREFEPEAGTAICAAQGFEPALEEGLLTMNLVDDEGETSVIRVALRCAQ